MALSAAPFPEPMGGPELPARDFLVDLFQTLNESGIEYCIERNYEGLPFDLQGHDIDILLRKESIPRVLKIIRGAAARNGGRTTATQAKSEGLRWVVCLGKTETGEFWGARIDLKPGTRWRGLEVDDYEDIMQNSSWWFRNIRVQDQDRAAVFALIGNIFYGLDHTVNRYGEKAAAAYQRSPKKVERLVENVFGRAGQQLIEILRTGDLDKLKNGLGRMKLALVLRKLRTQPLDVIKWQVKNLLNYAGRLVHRTGIVVACLGLDGSGKTTLCALARGKLEVLIHARMEFLYHRPSLLPSLARLLGRKEDPEESAAHPHGKSTSGFLGSLARLDYYTLDYTAGYWLKIYPRLARSPHIVLFDRYFYGYFIDSRRSRISLPDWVLRFFNFFVPQPDLVIMLIPRPEVFYERKKELPLEVLRRQSLRMYELSRFIKNVAWVDTGGSLEKSRDDFLGAVLEAFGRHLHWS